MFTGLQRVKEYLKVNDGRAKIYFFKNCVNLIRELKSYRWGEGDRPKKTDDHALDELRYYLMHKPTTPIFNNERPKVSMDKDRLIKKIKNDRKIR